MVARKTPRKGQTSLIAASTTVGADFSIVGIGASAGRLGALNLFLRHVPPDCGIPFVIVQHLDPTYKGVMAELRQRAIAMSGAAARRACDQGEGRCRPRTARHATDDARPPGQ